MTVKITNNDPDPSVVNEVICKNCGRKLSYVPNDVKEYRGHDYSGGSSGRDYIECPGCDKQVTIRSW